MRDVGINTIEGWFHDQFDEVSLGEAQRHGLGVILPFAGGFAAVACVVLYLTLRPATAAFLSRAMRR